MLPAPTFASRQEQRSRIGDADFWWPYLSEILARHGRLDATRTPEAGFNSTYPTFLYGDLVVKLFGSAPAWQQSHAAEQAAHALLATDPALLAPRVLAGGQLYEDAEACWPYLISTRVSGVARWRASLSPEQERTVAAEMGRQVRRLHALPVQGIATDAGWPDLDVAGAVRRSSLPEHLAAQAEAYLAYHQIGPDDASRRADRAVTHADIVANHAYVEDGHLVGIIDWGDTVATDRHYELAQIFRDLLNCDKALFRVFLEAADWPIAEDFPHRTLGWGILRQTLGLAEHGSMDVFMPIARAFPLQDIPTLDELAVELFSV